VRHGEVRLARLVDYQAPAALKEEELQLAFAPAVVGTYSHQPGVFLNRVRSLLKEFELDTLDVDVEQVDWRVVVTG